MRKSVRVSYETYLLYNELTNEGYRPTHIINCGLSLMKCDHERLPQTSYKDLSYPLTITCNDSFDEKISIVKNELRASLREVIEMAIQEAYENRNSIKPLPKVKKLSPRFRLGLTEDELKRLTAYAFLNNTSVNELLTSYAKSLI